MADESFSHIRTVRAFARERYQGELYEQKLNATYDLGVRTVHTALRYGMIMYKEQIFSWCTTTMMIDCSTLPGIIVVCHFESHHLPHHHMT